jgi:hypothetical protein
MAAASPSERHLSGLLLIGMLTVPVVFVWFFLRQGYSRSLRWTASTYTIVTTGILVLGRTLGGP